MKRRFTITMIALLTLVISFNWYLSFSNLHTQRPLVATLSFTIFITLRCRCSACLPREPFDDTIKAWHDVVAPIKLYPPIAPHHCPYSMLYIQRIHIIAPTSSAPPPATGASQQANKQTTN